MLSKSQCRLIAPAGWVYIGTEGAFYLYQSGDYADGFKLMRAIDCDMTADNLARMASLNISR